jgi:hypothetical protein
VSSAEVERLTEQWLRSSARLQADGAANAPVSRKQAAKNTLTYLIRLAALENLAAELGVPAETQPPEGEHANGELAAAELAAAEVSASDLEASGLSRPDFVRTFGAAHLSRAIAEKLFPEVAVRDSDLRRDYDQHPEAFTRNWEARVGVAYFDAEGPARQLPERVRGGEPFEEAGRRLGAREATTLDRVTPLTPLPQPVLSAMAGAPPGEISAPVTSSGGFLVFVVEHRRDLPARSFEEAREELRARHQDLERQNRFTTWFVGRLRKERVQVSSYYGRWDAATGLVA